MRFKDTQITNSKIICTIQTFVRQRPRKGLVGYLPFTVMMNTACQKGGIALRGSNRNG
jgi:hypothetical protein